MSVVLRPWIAPVTETRCPACGEPMTPTNSRLSVYPLDQAPYSGRRGLVCNDEYACAERYPRRSQVSR